MENEEREPDTKMLKQLANYFNVSIDYLLDNEESIKENELVKLERKLKKDDKERLIIILKTMFPNEYEETKKEQL